MNQITHALTTIFTIPETQVSYNFKNPVSLGMGHGLNLLCGDQEGIVLISLRIGKYFPGVLSDKCKDVPVSVTAFEAQKLKEQHKFFFVCVCVQFF